MRRALLVILGSIAPCAFAHDNGTEHQPDSVAAVDPGEPARQRFLIGDACSWTTGMVAKRVLDEGETYTFTGFLSPRSDDLDSHVAAPFAIGPDDATRVVANEVVDAIVDRGLEGSRLTLEGRRLDVEDTSLFVPTAFVPAPE